MKKGWKVALGVLGLVVLGLVVLQVSGTEVLSYIPGDGTRP